MTSGLLRFHYFLTLGRPVQVCDCGAGKKERNGLLMFAMVLSSPWRRFTGHRFEPND